MAATEDRRKLGTNIVERDDLIQRQFAHYFVQIIILQFFCYYATATYRLTVTGRAFNLAISTQNVLNRVNFNEKGDLVRVVVVPLKTITERLNEMFAAKETDDCVDRSYSILSWTRIVHGGSKESRNGEGERGSNWNPNEGRQYRKEFNNYKINIIPKVINTPWFMFTETITSGRAIGH